MIIILIDNSFTHFYNFLLKVHWDMIKCKIVFAYRSYYYKRYDVSTSKIYLSLK